VHGAAEVTTRARSGPDADTDTDPDACVRRLDSNEAYLSEGRPTPRAGSTT
jgi:hypothetical protein